MALAVSALTLLLSSVALGTPFKLVLLNDAVSKGAVCLDGSPPGYYFRPGVGSGQSKLIIHLKGGGWCYNEDECVERSKGDLGSSKNWPTAETFNGFISDDPQVNPLFFNWTVMYLMYCDGASFAGNVDNVVNWKGTDLHFRGFRILQYAMESIQSTGNFTEVILTGTSAGGLATYLHTDYVRGLFFGVKFNALADAGFFLDAPNVTGEYHIRSAFTYVFKMQNVEANLNHDCVKSYTANNEEWKCFFPQYSQPFIKTRIFALNSQFDTWQLTNILQLGCVPPKCSASQMKLLEDYGQGFRKAASDFVSHGDGDRGLFVDACLKHTQSQSDSSWTGIKVNGQPANETFAAWYYGTGRGQEVDCPTFSCNDTC